LERRTGQARSSEARGGASSDAGASVLASRILMPIAAELGDTHLASMSRTEKLTGRIRALLLAFMIGLVLSGLTAFPLETELGWLTAVLGAGPGARLVETQGVLRWLVTVREALVDTNARYPFLAYGTDWLAFAHLVIAMVFIGPFREPVRNQWVVTFGLLACVAVVPLALIAGAVRGIPFYWRLIDCTFGIAGAALLWPCRRAIQELERRGVTH
jgi:hypothetical protein